MSQAPVLPRKAVQDEWDAMMRRIHEVATVLEASTQVDALNYACIIFDPVGSDLAMVEEILLSNLLFHPRTRTEDGRTVEFVGAWLWSWRRYAAWTTEETRMNKWIADKYPGMRVYAYKLESVQVEL
jgi:hypothetical protein